MLVLSKVLQSMYLSMFRHVPVRRTSLSARRARPIRAEQLIAKAHYRLVYNPEACMVLYTMTDKISAAIDWYYVP